ncbi:MAG: CHASE domain-containing protein [Gallionella sp.]|jgi:diguanylate cyclase (GGDEF)-like protein/PAS domain S-box-containing protein
MKNDKVMQHHNDERLAGASRRSALVALPLLILFISLFATYHVYRAAQQDADRQLQAYFDFRVRETIEHLEQRVQAYEQVLRGASGLFKASVSVERAEYARYIASLQLTEHFPGIQGVGFSLIVPVAQKDRHIAAVRSEGFPGYSIRPEGQRDLYTAIVYLEPFADRNLRAFGYDMYFETVRRAAMQKAIDSAEATLSGKVKLVQESGSQEQAGFLMYFPIFRNDAPRATLSERRQNALGWVYAPFRMGDFMKGAYGERADDLDIEIFDGEDISSASLMYDSDDSMLTGTTDKSVLQVTQRLQIADHPWTVRVCALPGMLSRIDADRPRLFLLAGCIGSVLLALLVWMLLSGRERAIKAAQKMNEVLITEQRHLNGIIEGTHVGTWEWNIQTGETVINRYWANIIGYEPEELGPVSVKNWIKLTHPDDMKLSCELLEKHFSGELSYYECEVRMLHRDGHWVWALDRGKVATWTQDKKPLMMFGTHQDITERKQAEAALRESESRFRFILENSPIAVRIASILSSRVVFANQRYAELIASRREAVFGINPKQYYANPQDYVDVIEQLSRGERVTNKLIELHIPNEHTKWTLASYLQLEYQGEPAVLGWFYDITDRRAMEVQVQHLAHYDPLTDLPNRTLFTDRLQQALSIAKRDKAHLALMFIDLDKFKPINDTLGHDVGDMVLKEVAKRIQTCLRESDTVARIGGDEFVVLLPVMEATQNALGVAEKIRHSLNQPFELVNRTLNISSSTGVVIYPEHGSDEKQLIKNADTAMYCAKAAGRDCVKIYHPEI